MPNNSTIVSYCSGVLTHTVGAKEKKKKKEERNEWDVIFERKRDFHYSDALK